MVCGDETWLSVQHPASRICGAAWMAKGRRSHPTEVRSQPATLKVLLILFHDSKGVIFREFLNTTLQHSATSILSQACVKASDDDVQTSGSSPKMGNATSGCCMTTHQLTGHASYRRSWRRPRFDSGHTLPIPQTYPHAISSSAHFRNNVSLLMRACRR